MSICHPFPRLPAELRAQIWELTVESRTVDVRIVQKRIPVLPDVPSTRSGLASYLVSHTPVPATQQTCQESRNLGLYQRAFSDVYLYNGVERRYVWANLDIDIIDIGTTELHIFLPVASLIHRLKFARENQDFFFHAEVYELPRFSNVKELHVVCAAGLWQWLGASEDHYWACGVENVFMIDPDDGRKMGLVEMEEMFAKELTETWRLKGYQYPSGDPLDETSENI
jgi:hypothetical protein